jgi:hypothetical protein
MLRFLLASTALAGEHPYPAGTVLAAVAMTISHGKKSECAMTREGVESQISAGAKGPPSSPRKNSGGEIFFVACCFLVKLLVPNETPTAKFRLTEPGMWFSVSRLLRPLRGRIGF